MKLSERTPVSELHKTCPKCGSEEMDVSNHKIGGDADNLVPREFCWMCGWSRILKGEPLFSPPGTYDDSPSINKQIKRMSENE